jgi:hypothetical protein
MRNAIVASCAFACLLGLGCHGSRQPSPEDVFNETAKLSGALPYPVLDWDMLTTSVDRDAFGTSTLFGNSAAAAAARDGKVSYPAGAVLGLVTWRERDDPHWFGARIPDVPSSVEFVAFGADGKPAYRSFAGAPLREQTNGTSAERIAAIEAMKPVTLP